jgi:hypothetical protein
MRLKRLLYSEDNYLRESNLDAILWISVRWRLVEYVVDREQLAPEM